jgi:hypothetical protein
MTTALNDTVDYVLTVAVMSWLQNGHGTPDELTRTTDRADRLGVSILGHLVDAGAIQAVSTSYQWRPVYDLILEPAIDEVFRPGEDTFTAIRGQARCAQLDRCVSYLIGLCRQSPNWAGSSEGGLLENLASRIASRRPAPTAPHTEPWARELIAPSGTRTNITDEP